MGATLADFGIRKPFLAGVRVHEVAQATDRGRAFLRAVYRHSEKGVSAGAQGRHSKK